MAIVPDGVHTKGKKFGRGGILKAEWLRIHVSHKCVKGCGDLRVFMYQNCGLQFARERGDRIFGIRSGWC